MRGNRRPPTSSRRLPWSIPAYAGEPRCGYADMPVPAVYPRVCGGTSLPYGGEVTIKGGLSPRMRGNPSRSPLPPARGWSIPAYAGEPLPSTGSRSTLPVYPRVCGGTIPLRSTATKSRGLSPRMRGNRPCPSIRPPSRGSIPAYAGEPAFRQSRRTTEWVYPRVCGGTATTRTLLAPRAGLSPRMRGNLFVACIHTGGQGSIPAYAGEPVGGSGDRRAFQVYPRVCGGTPGPLFGVQNLAGLSPRMRGNQFQRIGSRAAARSIPAYAGEPRRPAPLTPRPQVYPRVCGGTERHPRAYGRRRGLSPRMRGNRGTGMPCGTPKRSIPAYAGEPREVSQRQPG